MSLYEQNREFTGVREDDPYWNGVSIQIGRGVLRRVDRAFKAFFRRVKAGQTPGYPRFKASARFRTIELEDVTPSMIEVGGDKAHVRIKGLAPMKLRCKDGLPDSRNLKSIRITRYPVGVYISLTYAVEVETEQPPSDKVVGIDVGIRSRLALSNGEFIERRTVDRRKVRRMQRKGSRCKRGSTSRAKRVRTLARAKHRERVCNRNACHVVTTDLTRRFGFVAIEDLPIPNMTRSAKGTVEAPGKNVRAKSGLNRSIRDQTWGIILDQLDYKAEWAGVQLVRVDPRFTSQQCSKCGAVAKDSRKGESYDCLHCEHSMNADTNAALNILRRGSALYEGGTSLQRPAGWNHQSSRMVA